MSNKQRIEINNYQIGVIGGGESNLPRSIVKKERALRDAYIAGAEIAKRGATLISGGMDGIMEASCRGAYLNGGMTVGTTGRERGLANKYVRIELLTPIDIGDYLFAGIPSCDSIIVFPGGAGTLAEIALAYRWVKPMIIMTGYTRYLDNLVGRKLDRSGSKLNFLGVQDPVEGVNLAIKEASQKNIRRNGN